MSNDLQPAETLLLTFKDKEAFVSVDDPIHKDLSTVTVHGETLFLSCDETAGIDRLTPDKSGYGNHVHFNLGELVELPDGPDGEMDIEGLAVDGDWIWVCGSHSLKREKPDDDDDPKAALDRMADIDWDENRAFLGRLPLVMEDGAPRPVARDGARRMAHVKQGKKSALKKWLKGDPHLDRFLSIPSKENGLDIEGIAVKGLRVWLGLRGPVLRGRAVILDMEMKVTKNGHLKPRRLADGMRYRKHLINTTGQGVRDLSFDGDDLIVLTGTALAGDGPSEVLRWRDAVADVTSGLVEPAKVETLAELPYRGAVDHPEGIVPWLKPGEWLAVYDSPAPERVKERPARVLADIWTF